MQGRSFLNPASGAVDAASDVRNAAFACSEKADECKIGLRAASPTYRDTLDLADVLFRVVVDVESDQFRT